MNFKFNINLNEKDYLNMNVFWSFKSPYGKKEIIKMRLWIAAICLVGAFFSALSEKLLLWSIVGMIPYFIILVIFQFLLKPFWIMILKANIKSMKKKGKLPFSAASEIEFFDEIFIERTADNNSEIKYSAVERVSILSNKVIYIHINNLSGYALPFSSFESKVQYDDFIDFIESKCAIVDIY